jgi:hypothetical protein
LAFVIAALQLGEQMMTDFKLLNAPNDKLSCRAAPGGPFLSYRRSIPIELTPRGQLQRHVVRNKFDSRIYTGDSLIIVNKQPTGRRGTFFYNSYELRSERSTSIRRSAQYDSQVIQCFI